MCEDGRKQAFVVANSLLLCIAPSSLARLHISSKARRVRGLHVSSKARRADYASNGGRRINYSTRIQINE